MAAVTGTTYLLHFDRPFGHARHYTGNPESFGILNGGSRMRSVEFANFLSLAPSAVARPC